MKLFVTGVCGRLGRAIATEAPRQGHTVLGIDTAPWPGASRPPPPGVEVHSVSYEDIAAVECLLPACDAVIHAAGLHGDFVGQLDLAGFLRANVERVASLLEAAGRQGIRRAALSSTMEVLVGRDWRASGATVLDEQSAPACDSPYSISQLLQEQLGAELARALDMSVASLRYVAFGYRADSALGPSLLARAITATDAARACIRAVGLDNLRGEVFTIGPKTPLTSKDILAGVKDPDGVVERYFPGATETLRASGCQLSCDHLWPVTSIRKAGMMLGWAPRYTFESWLVEHGWESRPA